MKALVVRAPFDIAVEDRADPARLADEVLVRTSRAGICGTDYHIYGGQQPFLTYPRVIGHELAGTVLEAGQGSGFRAGQAVVINPYVACGVCHACGLGKPNCCMKIGVLGVHRDGGMCEMISVPARNLIDADGLDAEQAASVEYLAIGAHAVRRAGAGAGQQALVVGGGPIGIAAALFAWIAGADVTIADRDAERLSLVAERTGLKTLLSDARMAQSVAELTGANGFGIVFDATGSRASMEAGFAHVAHGGTYVLVGLVRDDITFSDPEFHKREMTLMASRNATDRDFAHVMAAIRTGAAQPERLITHRTTLDSAAADLPRWHADKAGLIKAIIEVT